MEIVLSNTRGLSRGTSHCRGVWSSVLSNTDDMTRQYSRSRGSRESMRMNTSRLAYWIDGIVVRS